MGNRRATAQKGATHCAFDVLRAHLKLVVRLLAELALQSGEASFGAPAAAARQLVNRRIRQLLRQRGQALERLLLELAERLGRCVGLGLRGNASRGAGGRAEGAPAREHAREQRRLAQRPARRPRQLGKQAVEHGLHLTLHELAQRCLLCAQRTLGLLLGRLAYACGEGGELLERDSSGPSVKPSRAKCRAKPSRASSPSKPLSQAKRSQPKPSQAKPSQTKAIAKTRQSKQSQASPPSQPHPRQARSPPPR